MKKNISLLFVGLAFIFILVGSIYFFISRPTPNAKPGNCKILEEKYCQQVHFITFTKDKLVFAAYTVPAGTTLFAPSDFELLNVFKNAAIYRDTSTRTTYINFGKLLNSTNNIGTEFIASIYSPTVTNIPQTPDGKVNQLGKKGDRIGIISDTTPILKGMPYNLLVLIANQTFPTIHPAPIAPKYTYITESFLKP